MTDGRPGRGSLLLRQVIDGRLVGGSYLHKEKKVIRASGRRNKELDGDGVFSYLTPFFLSSSCTKGRVVVRSKDGGLNWSSRVCRSRFGANFTDLGLLNLTRAC